MIRTLLLVLVIPVMLLAVPEVPSNLQLVPGTTTVDISWQDNSDNESGFKIFRDDQLIYITKPNETHFQDMNLTPSTTYKYTVKATDDQITTVNIGDIGINLNVAGHYDILVDIDNNTATGYSNGDNRGMDILIEDGVLYRSNGNTSQWRWSRIGNIYTLEQMDKTVVKLPTQILEALHPTEGGSVRIYQSDSNWQNRYLAASSSVKHISIVGTISKTYYVDSTNGNDDSDGSSTHPLKHIQKAVDLARAGDRIFVKRGLYFESIHITKSGREDSPIVIEGERDANGKLLTHIHGGERITGEWVSAEGDHLDGVRLGSGTYKLTGVQGNTYTMTIYQDGVFKDIPRVDLETVPFDSRVKYYDKRAEVFNIEPSAVVHLDYRDKSVRYWDGIEALYTQVGDTLYIRFRDYQNPNNLTLYRAGGDSFNISRPREDRLNENIRQSATFKIDNASYITLKNLKIDGAQSGVMIVGKDAHHNRVEACDIVNGQRRILITQKAHHNLITHNRLHMVLLSKYRPMAWWDVWRLNHTDLGEENYKYVVAQHYYEAYKHEIGLSASSPQDDTGVYLYAAGSGNEIAYNEIFDTLAGVFGDEIGDVKIHHNYFHHISGTSVGRGRGFDGDGAYVYQNNFINVHIGIRFNPTTANNAKEKLWFYDNLIYNPLGLGVGIYPSIGEDAGNGHPELYFYHNTVVNVGREDIDKLFGDENIFFVNNLYYRSYFRLPQNHKMGYVDYNWFGELNTIGGVATRYGDHNIEANGKIPFRLPDSFSNSRTDFVPSNESGARGAGIDLSTPFEIDGKRFNPMPGMQRDYSHDMGIVTY